MLQRWPIFASNSFRLWGWRLRRTLGRCLHTNSFFLMHWRRLHTSVGILLSSYLLRLKLGSLQATFQIFRHPIASNRIQWNQRTLPPFPLTCKTGALPPSIRQSRAGYSRKNWAKAFASSLRDPWQMHSAPGPLEWPLASCQWCVLQAGRHDYVWQLWCAGRMLTAGCQKSSTCPPYEMWFILFPSGNVRVCKERYP